MYKSQSTVAGNKKRTHTASSHLHSSRGNYNLRRIGHFASHDRDVSLHTREWSIIAPANDTCVVPWSEKFLCKHELGIPL